jgi:predicted ATPase/class 3 adenylate cyclase
VAQRVRTFLFTDIEGSTRIWDAREDEMSVALERHDAVLRDAVQRHGGDVLKHLGDGIVAVFEDPARAVDAAGAAQRSLRADHATVESLRVRMGIHVGRCRERDGDYFGPTLNHAARIMAAAHGGQVVVSSDVAALIGDHAPLVDLGRHRLRDVLEPQRLLQLIVDDEGRYPPLRSAGTTTDNLPRQRTTLIGREEDLATVRAMLRAGSLMTLAGVGGVGKTRLAIEVAAREVDRFGRVVFVDLSSVAEPEQVRDMLGTALGLAPGEAGDLSLTLPLLQAQAALVILDNCEHVLDASAELVDAVLDSCADVAVLATSREPLGVDAERVWRVPSLPGRAAGLELFCERAFAVSPGFAPTPEDDEVIGTICEQLDGIPLAIELAAARVAHLSVGDIAAHLDERFQLLAGGRRRARQRHQTLQAALDWSYDLLSPVERTILRYASVFVGGFALDALDAVAPEERAGHRLLEVLSSLVDKSLVDVVTERRSRTRYRLLETVRLYALDALAAEGEAADARDRHAAWISEWLRTSWDDISFGTTFGAGRVSPYSDERREERDNVLSALDWVDASGKLDALGVLATDAAAWLNAGVWVDDGWRYLGRVDIDAALPSVERARYRVASAANANALGDFARQAELAQHAREAPHGSPAWRMATGLLANALAVFEPKRAIALYEEVLGVIPEEARGERAWMLARSADPYLMTDDLVEGARHLDEAHAFSGVPDIDHGFPHLLLGRFADVADAIAAFRAQDADDLVSRYRAPLLEAMLAAEHSRFEDAGAALLEAGELVTMLPLRLVDADVLVGVGAVAQRADDVERAARIIACVTTAGPWGRSPGTFAICRHHRRAVRRTLGEERWRAIVETVRRQEETVAGMLAQELGRLREQHAG